MKDLYIVIVIYYTREVLFQSITSCLMMKGINNVIVISSGNPIEDIKKLEYMDAEGKINRVTRYSNILLRPATSTLSRLR